MGTDACLSEGQVRKWEETLKCGGTIVAEEVLCSGRGLCKVGSVA